MSNTTFFGDFKVMLLCLVSLVLGGLGFLLFPKLVGAGIVFILILLLIVMPFIAADKQVNRGKKKND